MSTFKPMLAAACLIENLQFPLIASAKLDGIRGIVSTGQMLSRSLKLIPNAHVQALFGSRDLDGLDGELIVGPPNASDVYRVSNSALMSHDGEPDVTFYVFDRHDAPSMPFTTRLKMLNAVRHPRIKKLAQHYVSNLGTLLELEQAYLNEGYEGLILRHPDGQYKHGRSTEKQGWMLKLKRFTDAEAEIIGFEELLSNKNEAKKDALGHTERSSHKENMVPMNTLGALLVRNIETGVEFSIGTGFTASDREEIFTNRNAYTGQIVKFKSFEIGVKDKPRFPVFLGFRNEEDM